MKKQFTLPTSLVFFSYTRTLSTLISKFCPSLLLLMSIILFSQVSFAQATITSASVNDDMPVPGYYFSAKNIETCVAPCSNCTTAVNVAPHLIAFVSDGDCTVYASFTPERKAGLTVTDDMGNFAFFPFDAATYSIGSPTVFKNPDVVLLEDSRTAIVTFETDDATYNSYVLELDIVATSSSININQTTGMNFPIGTIFSSSPRIDGDYAKDRFAIVTIQYNVPIYSVYEPDGFGSYQTMTNLGNITAGNANNTAMLPDISLGHLVGGAQDPECVVSYVDGDPNGSTSADLIVNYQDNTPATINQLIYSLPSNTLFTSYDTYPNYPHICSEEEFTTSGTMQWALAESLVDPAIANSSGLFPNHLLYVHSDYYYQSNINALFYVDMTNTSTNTYQQGKGTLDWMSTDGFVAWRHEIASPNTQQIAGFMNPFTSPLTMFSNWDQVYYNYNVATVTGTDWLQALSVGSDASTNFYVVAELFIGKIIYKVRQIGTTGFKPNNISITNKYIYPNPCNNILNIITIDDERISVKDIIGNTVQSTKLKKGLNRINTSYLSEGNYFLIRGNNISNSLFTVSH